MVEDWWKMNSQRSRTNRAMRDGYKLHREERKKQKCCFQAEYFQEYIKVHDSMAH
jgi:hypothetical protein